MGRICAQLGQRAIAVASRRARNSRIAVSPPSSKHRLCVESGARRTSGAEKAYVRSGGLVVLRPHRAFRAGTQAGVSAERGIRSRVCRTFTGSLWRPVAAVESYLPGVRVRRLRIRTLLLPRGFWSHGITAVIRIQLAHRSVIACQPEYTSRGYQRQQYLRKCNYSS